VRRQRRAIKRRTVTALSHLDHPRARVQGNLLRAVRRAVIADHHLAVNFGAFEIAHGLANARLQRLRFVQAGHDDAQFDRHRDYRPLDHILLEKARFAAQTVFEDR